MNITLSVNDKRYRFSITRWWHETMCKTTRWWEVRLAVYGNMAKLHERIYIWPPSARPLVSRLHKETKFQATLELYPRPTGKSELLPIIYRKQQPK